WQTFCFMMMGNLQWSSLQDQWRIQILPKTISFIFVILVILKIYHISTLWSIMLQTPPPSILILDCTFVALVDSHDFTHIHPVLVPPMCITARTRSRYLVWDSVYH